MIFYRFASAISAFTLLVGRFFYKIRMPEGFSLAFGHSNIIMELLYSGAIAEQKQFQPNCLQSIYFKDGSAIAGFLKKKLNSDKLTLDKSLALMWRSVTTIIPLKAAIASSWICDRIGKICWSGMVCESKGRRFESCRARVEETVESIRVQRFLLF